MSATTRKSEWTVLFGVGLLVFGALLLAERIFGWLFFPLSRVLQVVGNVGWPLVLVGLGVLLIMRGRNGGWTTTGKLFRSRTDRKIGGVLGGAAVYLRIDASLARLIYVLLTVLTGFWLGFFVYVIAMAVVPEEQFDYGTQGTPPAAPPVPPAPSSPSTTVAAPAPPATSSAV
jgi:phage shock protein C